MCLHADISLPFIFQEEEKTPLSATRLGLNAEWGATCCRKYILSHTLQTEALRDSTPHFHSLIFQVEVFFSFFFHSVWVGSEWQLKGCLRVKMVWLSVGLYVSSPFCQSGAYCGSVMVLYIGWLIFSMEEIAPSMLLLFSYLTTCSVCLSITNFFQLGEWNKGFNIKTSREVML